MFKYRSARNIIDSSISESIDTLQGLTSEEKDIVYNHIAGGLDRDIGSFEDGLSIAEKSGPPLWEYLHWMGRMADRERDPSIYTDSLAIMCKAHPCASVCRKHLATNLESLPPTSYTSMFEHSIDLHNLVNQQLGKPLFSMNDAYHIYDPDCDTCVFGA